MTGTSTTPEPPARVLDVAAVLLVGLVGVIAGLLAVGALRDGMQTAAGVQATFAALLLASAGLTWRRGTVGWVTVAGLALVVLWAAALGVVLMAVVSLGLGVAVVVSLLR